MEELQAAGKPLDPRCGLLVVSLRLAVLCFIGWMDQGGNVIEDQSLAGRRYRRAMRRLLLLLLILVLKVSPF